MCEITQQTQTLQVKTPLFRRRITQKFTAIPHGHLDGLPPLVRAPYMKLLELSFGKGRDSCMIEHEHLAKMFNRKRDAARRWVRILKRHGYIRSSETRISRCLNRPNVYTFPKLIGVFEKRDINAPQKQEKVLNTDTSTPREVQRGNKSYAQIRWEWNQARRKHRPGPYVGRCRMRHIEALRISAGASVGTWDPETKRLLREQEARIAEWERELRERGGVL